MRQPPLLSIGNTLRLAILAAFVIFFGIPMLWLVLAPSKDDGQLLSMPALAFGDIAGYGRALGNLLGYDDGQVVGWFINSVVYTSVALVIALATAIPAGYALAFTKFRGRRLLLWLTLIALLVPGSALVLPLFLEMSLLHLINNPLSVILPWSFFPFGVYLSYVFFATSLPRDLLSAGRVDGGSEWQVFRLVCLPLSRTLIGLLAFLSFTVNWNDFFLPFVMLNQDRVYPLQLGLWALVSGTPMVSPTVAAVNSVLKRPEGAMMGLIIALPVALVFILAQRYVVSGALTGAVKS